MLQISMEKLEMVICQKILNLTESLSVFEKHVKNQTKSFYIFSVQVWIPNIKLRTAK